MAKGAYIGVNNVARKIKKGYIGVNNVARKIKKAYIGIGGVARPCWSSDPVSYYGAITPLSYKRHKLAAGSNGYALFAGGEDGSTRYDTVDVYDQSLTHTTTTLSSPKCDVGSVSIKSYNRVLFAGGLNPTGFSNELDIYDASLTLTKRTLQAGYANLRGASVGVYAMFAGGQGQFSNGTLQICNYAGSDYSGGASITERVLLGSTSIGNYVLFGGGYSYNTMRYYDIVDGVSNSLVSINAPNLSVARQSPAGITVANYALFAGGEDGNIGNDVVDAYDSSLTHTIASPLSVRRSELSATSVGEFAIIAGGRSRQKHATVDIYDKSLTRTTGADLSVARYNLEATQVGNYALFGGGTDSGSLSSDVVDAYVVG